VSLQQRAGRNHLLAGIVPLPHPWVIHILPAVNIYFVWNTPNEAQATSIRKVILKKQRPPQTNFSKTEKISMNEKPVTDDSLVNAVDSPCSTPIACNARSGGAPEKRCSILRRNVVSNNGSTGKRASLLRWSIVSWAIKGKRASELSNSDTEHQPSASLPFWSPWVYMDFGPLSVESCNIYLFFCFSNLPSTM